MRLSSRLTVLAFGIGVLAVTVGCDDKAKEQAAAAEKTRQADEQAAKTKREADEKAAATKRDVEESARKAATDARAALQKDVDAADRKLAYLKTKSATLAGAAKKNADAAMAETEKRRDGIRQDMKTLETQTGAAWDTTKAKTAQAITALNQSIEALESTVTGKPAK